MSYNEEDPSGTKTIDTGSNASVLKPYSVGFAAANIKVGQTELRVVPSEKLTHLDGEVTDNVNTKTTSGIDSTGNNYSDNIDTSLAINAKWLSRDPWLKFPGLVRRGEEVQIWRVGDSDQYYWELLGTSNHLRRKDILLLVISNTRDEATTELTPANSVMFEINTTDGHIVLSTPKNDGEAVAYTIQLSMKESNFFISDDIGNSIVMASLKELIQLRNTSNTYVKLEKTKLELIANESILIKTKNLDIQTTTTKMSGTTMNWDYKTAELNGGAINVKYSTIGLAGTMSGTGNMAFSGGNLTHNGKNVGDGHKHPGIQRGDSSTDGPQ